MWSTAAHRTEPTTQSTACWLVGSGLTFLALLATARIATLIVRGWQRSGQPESRDAF